MAIKATPSSNFSTVDWTGTSGQAGQGGQRSIELKTDILKKE